MVADDEVDGPVTKTPSGVTKSGDVMTVFGAALPVAPAFHSSTAAVVVPPKDELASVT
jgi:hypothetical protein